MIPQSHTAYPEALSTCCQPASCGFLILLGPTGFCLGGRSIGYCVLVGSAGGWPQVAVNERESFLDFQLVG